MTVGERLKARRKELGLSAEKVAERLGVSPSTIYRYENGEINKMGIDKLGPIAAAVQATPAYLMGWDEEPDVLPAEIVLSADLADLDAQLNSTGHIELVTYAEFLVSQPEYRLEPGRRAQKIRHYLVPAAAGYASPIEGEDYEILEVYDAPAGADYCITVSGDSMEPYIKDGSLVFVKRSLDLTDFDVGVFYVDGDVLIKQLFVDPMHNIYLLSANPRREDANKMISHNSTSTLMCFGKVLINKLPRPNYL